MTLEGTLTPYGVWLGDLDPVLFRRCLRKAKPQGNDRKLLREIEE